MIISRDTSEAAKTDSSHKSSLNISMNLEYYY